MYHFYSHLVPCLKNKLTLLYGFVEDLSHHFSRLIVACFDVFGSDSFAVWGFAFSSLVIAVRNSSRDLWDSRHPSSIRCMSCCLFILFLSLIHFFIRLLTSFRRCFSSLGVILLSTMSLRISTSSFDISSVSFGAAVSSASSSSFSFSFV